MNKHIELVKKWLADKDSVSREERRVNAVSAAGTAWDADDAAGTAWKAAYAADEAFRTADWADTIASYAAFEDADDARVADWIKEYEELTGE